MNVAATIIGVKIERMEKEALLSAVNSWLEESLCISKMAAIKQETGREIGRI